MLVEELYELIETLRKMIQKITLDVSFDSEQWEGRSSTLILTDECNLRCTYCYCTKTPRIMSWDVAKEYIDFIFEESLSLADIPKAEQTEMIHRKIFEFIGGEPLLQASLMFKCMDYILERTEALPDNHPWKRDDWRCPVCPTPHRVPGIRFMISTNGLLLNDPGIRQGMEKWDSDYVSIGATLDGTREMHDLCRKTPEGEGSHAQVINAWRWLLKKYPPCATSTKSTIAHENIDYIYDIVKYFYNMGITTLAQNCVFENVWHRGDQHRLLRQLIKVSDFLIERRRYEKMKVRWFGSSYFEKTTSEAKWCGAGTYMDSCDAAGLLYPCLRFKELKIRPPFIFGDTKAGKNQEILDDFITLSKNVINNPEQHILSGLPECINCPVSALCADCQAFAYDCFGSLEAKSPFICPMHKAVCVANVYFFCKILELPIDPLYLEECLEAWTKNNYFSTDGDYQEWLSHQT